MTIEFKRTKEVTNTLCKPCRLLRHFIKQHKKHPVRHFIKQHKKHPVLINGAEITCHLLLASCICSFIVGQMQRDNFLSKVNILNKTRLFFLGQRSICSFQSYLLFFYIFLYFLLAFFLFVRREYYFSNVLIVFLSGFCRFVSFFLHFVQTGFQKRKAEIHHKLKFLVFE